ncbi:uncharacterized protein LOC142336036 isoform X1 [Convolutriloba macropyga]|uniref:uncharacterized protein LOC142336036 isoform X1 n=1 Tax=Convolutriloba macropyga TaxID=536237 RepID=UPI003F5219EE
MEVEPTIPNPMHNEPGPSRISPLKVQQASSSSLSPTKASAQQNQPVSSEQGEVSDPTGEIHESNTPQKPKENFCVPCDLQLNNSVAYKQHLLGLRHAKRVEELGGEGADSSAGVVDPIDTALGELQSARLVVMLQREKHEPIIGLDCLTERVCTLRSSDDPSYYCELCDAEFEMRDALFHVTGTQHRFLFLKATRASLISDLIDNNGDLISSESSIVLRAKLSAASAKLESEIGRGSPKIQRVASTTLSNRWSAQKNHPRVATVAPSSRSIHHNPVINRFSEEEQSHFRRRGGRPNMYDEREGRVSAMGGVGVGMRTMAPPQLGYHGFNRDGVDDRFHRRVGGGGYMDVDTPQGDRDYTMPTANPRLLPGEEPDSRMPSRSRSPAGPPMATREPKRRRMMGSRFPREELEEGEHTDDYDSMLDQYRQEKQDEWVKRNQQKTRSLGGRGVNNNNEMDGEREISPPPREEIFFQKYVREMHKEWEKWYDEKKQKEEQENSSTTSNTTTNTKENNKQKEKDTQSQQASSSNTTTTTSKKASNLKECKSILAQCRIKDESDAEVAIEISRALAEAHVQYRLRYMKPEEKTKETQDIYKTVLGYLREMQSGKIPSLALPSTSAIPATSMQAPTPGVMNPQQMFTAGAMIPPNMMPPPGQVPFPMPANGQFPPPMMFGNMPPPQSGAPTATVNAQVWPTDPRTVQPAVQHDWNAAGSGNKSEVSDQGGNPLMMTGDNKQQNQPPPPSAFSQQAAFYQGPSPAKRN